VSLDNKTIVVAGAGGLLGRAIVPALLRQGAHVIALDSSPLIYEASKHLFVLQGDITNAASLEQAFDAGVREFSRIDGAVNAAYPRNEHYGRPFLDVTFEDFSENVSLHLGGYFNFMQRCVRYALQTKERFSLVNLSSIYGSIAPRFDLYSETSMTMPVEYAAIKSAIQHLSTYATAYTKGSQFRVNCVSPGGILAQQDENFIARYKTHCRTKGMLDAKDIVGSILFLLSDDSEFVCGQTIVVDDGFHTL
jgi:NAD(P)-dependent dehydrogenase (short-subunit alcohol dehydrogenase family)